MIDGVALPSSEWIQTGSVITITMPAHTVGLVTVQIYNGQLPLLETGRYTYENVIVPPATPAITPCQTGQISTIANPCGNPPCVAGESSTLAALCDGGIIPVIQDPSTGTTNPVTPGVTPKYPLNLGPKVNGPLAKAISAKVYFNLGSAVISKTNLKVLKLIAAKTKGLGSKITIQVRGYAQPTKGTEKSDLALTAARAKSVAKALKAFGVNTKIEYLGMGRATVNSAKSRYVAINISNS